MFSYDLAFIALETLWSKKGRNVLSVLGVVIGVATIIIVVAIGIGAQRDIEEQFKNLSVTAISINPLNAEGAKSKLNVSDAEYIRENAEYVEAATAMYQSKLPVSSQGLEVQLTVLGIDVGFFDVSNLDIVAGRVFTDEELENKDRIVIIGSTAVDEFFGGDAQSSIGESVTISRKRLEIVGVIEESGASIGPTVFDDSVYLPYGTAAGTVLGTSGAVRLIANATTIDTIGIAMEELIVLLRDNHRLQSSQPNDFRLKDQGAKVTSAQESARTMSILLTVVAAVVLVVSGIGIMNVMLVTVTERTREIGIMKAVGAESITVLWQFLLESAALSVVGGIIGIIIGETLMPILSTLSDLTMIPSVFGVMLGFVFSVATGIIFGIYPAYKASKLDPVDALRAE